MNVTGKRKEVLAEKVMDVDHEGPVSAGRLFLYGHDLSTFNLLFQC